MCWQHLYPRLSVGGFVLTEKQEVRNEIREVGTDYVVVRSERTGRDRRIEEEEVEGGGVWNGAIIRGLRKFAGCDNWT